MKIDLRNLINSRRSAEENARRLAEQISTDLAATRKRMSEVAGLIENAKAAPADRKTVEQRATRLVDDALASLRSRAGLLDHLCAPADRFSENVTAVAAEGLTSFEMAALAGRDSLITSLVREAEAAGSDVGPALTESAREKLIAKLQGEARGLAAGEELLLRSLELTGAVAPRRADADPEILGAEDETLTLLADGEA